jgi:hypothetical protein
MDNFDLKKYLVENKVTTNSRMMSEYFEKETQDLGEAFAQAGIDMNTPVEVVEAGGGPGGSMEERKEMSPKALLRMLEKEKAAFEADSDEGEAVMYDFEAGEGYPGAKLAVLFSDQYEYIIYQKTSSSKMMNEISREAYEEIGNVIYTYSKEDSPEDVADLVGEMALESLEGETVPEGMFNDKMRVGIADILRQYSSKKMSDLGAAKKLVQLLKDSANYEKGEREQGEQGEQAGIKIGSADGVDISVGEESSLQDTQYYIITLGNKSLTVSVDVAGEPVTLEQVMSETGLSTNKAQIIVNHINSQLED